MALLPGERGRLSVLAVGDPKREMAIAVRGGAVSGSGYPVHG